METNTSNAQLEVWQWKERLYNDVKHLPTLKEQMKAIHIIAQKGVSELADLFAKKSKNEAGSNH